MSWEEMQGAYIPPDDQSLVEYNYVPCIYLHACQMRVTVGDSSLCCFVCTKYFERNQRRIKQTNKNKQQQQQITKNKQKQTNKQTTTTTTTTATTTTKTPHPHPRKHARTHARTHARAHKDTTTTTTTTKKKKKKNVTVWFICSIKPSPRTWR